MAGWLVGWPMLGWLAGALACLVGFWLAAHWLASWLAGCVTDRLLPGHANPRGGHPCQTRADPTCWTPAWVFMNYTTRTQKINISLERLLPSPPPKLHLSCDPVYVKPTSSLVLRPNDALISRPEVFFLLQVTRAHSPRWRRISIIVCAYIYIYIYYFIIIYIYVYICAYKYTVPHENINDIGTGVRVPWVPLLTSWSNVSPTQSFFALLIPPHSHVVGACWDNFNNPKESATNATFRTGDKRHGVRSVLIFWHYGKRQMLASVVSLSSCF